MSRRLTTKEAAAELRMHPDTLKRLVAARLVPHHRPTGTSRFVYFTDEDLDAIDAAGKVEPMRPAAVVRLAARSAA